MCDQVQAFNKYLCSSNFCLSQRDLSRPKLIDFHGVSMTHAFTDNWDKVQNFKAKPDDIVVATYPKAGNLYIWFSCSLLSFSFSTWLDKRFSFSGTTWMCYILDLLYFHQTCPEREKSVSICDRVPFLEFIYPPYCTGQNVSTKTS